MAKAPPKLSPEDIQRVIATAWDDLPPYNKVLMEHGIGHGQLVALLKREMTLGQQEQNRQGPHQARHLAARALTLPRPAPPHSGQALAQDSP
jgi:hypothetical protein